MSGKNKRGEMNKFVKERDEAFIELVMEDKTEKLFKYCIKYKILLPSNEKIMKTGIYKAVQECTTIPQNVKNIAKKKCIALGFKPYINYD